MKQQFTAVNPEKEAVVSKHAPARGNILNTVLNFILYVEEKVNPFYFWGRAIVYTGILIWGWQFIRMDFTVDPFEIGNSYMHNINLIFHEAGHIIFMPFGWFMTILGGTLGQLLMPVIVMLVFLIKHHNNFAASVALWWLGQSFIDCAPYIDDALEQKLVLLGGHTGADAPGNHDWNNILVEFNAVERHREFATMADMTGSSLILAAFVWGGVILFRQYQNLEKI